MKRWCLISFLWLAAVAAATTLRVPWERPHPTDPNLSIFLGYAPLWSHRFAQTASAHPDGTHLVFALILAFVLPLTLAADGLMGRFISRASGSLEGDVSRNSTSSGSFRNQVEKSAKVFPFPENPGRVSSSAASRQA